MSTIDTVSTVTHWAAWTLAIVSMADFICGFVHWLEDNYGREDTPIIGATIIAPNRLHHTRPRAFITKTWRQSANIQIMVSLVVLAVALWGGWFSWGLLLLVVLATNGNEVHKWSHRTRAENGRFITWLQNRAIVQTRRHHANHHRGLRNSHYCSITNWVNPILDKLGFWRGLEFCIYKMAGVSPRIEVAQS
jgi:hypothetical protein